MRTVEIKPPHTGKFPEKEGLTWQKAQAAINYMALWGFHPETMNEPSHVEINICYDGEITAYFEKEKGSGRGMLMVAVWRHDQKEYTFHT